MKKTLLNTEIDQQDVHLFCLISTACKQEPHSLCFIIIIILCISNFDYPKAFSVFHIEIKQMNEFTISKKFCMNVFIRFCTFFFIFGPPCTLTVSCFIGSNIKRSQ